MVSLFGYTISIKKTVTKEIEDFYTSIYQALEAPVSFEKKYDLIKSHNTLPVFKKLSKTARQAINLSYQETNTKFINVLLDTFIRNGDDLQSKLSKATLVFDDVYIILDILDKISAKPEVINNTYYRGAYKHLIENITASCVRIILQDLKKTNQHFEAKLFDYEPGLTMSDISFVESRANQTPYSRPELERIIQIAITYQIIYLDRHNQVDDLEKMMYMFCLSKSFIQEENIEIESFLRSPHILKFYTS